MYEKIVHASKDLDLEDPDQGRISVSPAHVLMVAILFENIPEESPLKINHKIRTL